MVRLAGEHPHFARTADALLARRVSGYPCVAHHRWKKVAGGVDEFFKKTTIADLLEGNPRATAEAREVIQSARLSNRRTSHGSVA